MTKTTIDNDARWATLLLLTLCVLVLWPSSATAAESPPFGLKSFSLGTTEKTEIIEASAGKYRFVNVSYTFTQAGGHPWALTATGEFTNGEVETQDKSGRHAIVPTQDVRDVITELPAGLLGNPTAASTCPLGQILGGQELCPADTQVGVYRLVWLGGKEQLAPIVNVTPEFGQSAEFGLENPANVVPVLTGHLVRTSQGYGITVVSNQIPIVGLVAFELTFWGVPADPSHDPMRGRFCNSVVRGEPLSCQGSGNERSGLARVPFMTMPTDCSAGPLTTTVLADSWENPGRAGLNGQYQGYDEKTALLPGVTGCDRLQFNPTIDVRPDTLLADAPVGLNVEVQVPQVEKPAVPATPELRNAVVTLPEGLSIGPGIVDGIQACDLSGPEGINFTGPESEEVGPSGELQLAPGHCPDASIVGTAEAETPLLQNKVEGHVYLARPECGAPGQLGCAEKDALDGKLYRLYLELGGAGALARSGVNIKVAGDTEANPATGQLTTRFEDNPQLPFSKLIVHLNGGPRAPLDNPAVCGAATTTADFTPWSAPGITPEGLSMTGTPDATPAGAFDVVGCQSPAGLSPGFAAGTVTPQAGAFSAFTMNLSRQDREQYVKGVQVHTPPGLLGILASVPLCGEPAASEGTCPEASRIGSTRVASGAGSHPFEIGGSVYLTGPYAGAPFGLSIVTNAVAGPFNLGLVVVRARIDVDPETSTLTVTTDETGPHAIPQIIFGVPLRLKRVTVDIDRAKFMFNPTNCSALRVTATISGSESARTEVSSPFAVGGCRSLVFKPKFTVSTNGHTSRIKGASLDAKLSYPSGSIGKDANIARVKVALPKQLPSRLTTLQKACPAATFAANAAGCPAGSIVGTVRAKTPLLPVGLSGPVYFVSHGGEAFPSLIVVLQGDNVRVDLTGTTFINKAGITSSTFKTVPDVPVSTFELYLPQGKGSALAANGNLCKSRSKLKMPTEFVAQNGAVMKQTTKIQVTGCPKKKAKASQSERINGHGEAGK
jgi:hypothetical protein